MTQETAELRKPSNAYNIFILVLTVLSLAMMVVMLLPVSEATLQLLSFYDNLICVIFLIDFFLNLRGAGKKSDYFIGQRGWLDLLGSIPSFGLLQMLVVCRPLAPGPLEPAGAHHSAAAWRAEKGAGQGCPRAPQPVRGVYYHLFDDPGSDVASVLVLQFESRSPDANITTGGDALWYSIVTITTVGYGDFYPVTTAGRTTAIFIMFTGVGIIGALASILASLLVAGSPAAEEEEAVAPIATAAPAATAARLPTQPPPPCRSKRSSRP